MTARYLLPLLSACLLCASFYLGSGIHLPKIEINNQTQAYTFRSDFLRFFGLGLKRLIADVTWIQTLIESDLEHYEGGDLNSWLYLRFMTISQLDPNFYENYYFGGQYLMIVKDDLLGAENLMKRGLFVFPDDYGLNWQLGFLFAIERGDVKQSFPFFEKIKDHPRRPKFFSSFYSKILVESLDEGDAYALSLETWRRLPEGDIAKDRLAGQLYTLKGMRDLKCLNENQIGCDREDFEGNPYFLSAEGVWKARKKFVRTKLKRIPKNEGKP